MADSLSESDACENDWGDTWVPPTLNTAIMADSLSESDACGNDWDNTWVPPTRSESEPSDLPFCWQSPWKKVDVILVDHCGQKEELSDETGCFLPVKFQYLITHRLHQLQTVIYKIQSLNVKSIQTGEELLEITTKTDVHVGAGDEIATVLSNELEDIYLKIIKRFPFTCSIAGELFKGQMGIMMIRDDTRVYIVGPSTCKTLICNTIDQFNSLISKESISFDEKWKRVAIGYLKTVPFLLQQYPTVSISTNDDANKILLQGAKSDVRNAVKELHDVMSSVHVEQIPIDSLVGKLLLCPEASSLFSSILESQLMTVSWTIDGNSLTVVSKETIPAGIVHQLLIENFVVAGFSSKDNSSSGFTNREPFCNTVRRNENSLLVVEKESTGYKVASTKLIMRDLLHREHFCCDMVCESVQAGKSHSDIEDLVTKNRTLENNLHHMKTRYDEALAEIERLKSNFGSKSQPEVKMKASTDKLRQQECYTSFSGDVVQEGVTRNYTADQPVRHQRQMPVPVFPTPKKSAVHIQGLHYGEPMETSVDPSEDDDFEITNEGMYKKLRYSLNPSMKTNELMPKVKTMIAEKNLKFDEVHFEVISSFEDVTWLNIKLKDELGIDGGVLRIHQGDQLDNIEQSKKELQCKSGQNTVVKIPVKYMEYKMLKFFCPECPIFNHALKYENGVLTMALNPGETEDAHKFVVSSKLYTFQTYYQKDIPMKDGSVISDTMWKDVISTVNKISSNIFCYKSNNKEVITLICESYEKLHNAKTNCEFVLGNKSQNKGGRRNRVFATYTDLRYCKGTGPESSDTGSRDSNPQLQRSLSSGSSPSTTSTEPQLKFTTPEGLVVLVYVGNILNLNVDCIVNAANENLSHVGEVAEVISRAAGYGFQQESDDYISQHGKLKVTECCITSAGSLPYKCVIHAVGPRWYDYPHDKRQCAKDLELTILNCLFEADRKQLQTIAIPAISSGIFGVPKDVCCKQYGEAVINFSTHYGGTTSLKEIHLMDKDSAIIKKIQDELKARLVVTGPIASPSGSIASSPAGNRVSFSGHDISKPASSNTSFSRSYSGPSRTSSRKDDGKASFAGTVMKERFNKQYMTQNGLKISIVEDDIIKMKVDVIICPQDDNCLSKGRIAKDIEAVSNERYKRDVRGMKTVKRTEVKRIQASPSTLPFKYVLQTVAPRWDKEAVKDKSRFKKDLKLTFQNILRHCNDSKDIVSVAIPVLGVGADGHATPYDIIGPTLSSVVCKESEGSKFKLQELYIVVNQLEVALSIAEYFEKENKFVKLTSFQRSRKHRGKSGEDRNSTGNSSLKEEGDGAKQPSTPKLGTTVKGGNLDDCVICMETPVDPRKLKCGHVFCNHCISHHFKVNNPKCPTCGSIQGQLTGDQPPGTMTVYKSVLSLTGYERYGRIEITYNIPAGRQGPEHKTPGQHYDSIYRKGYLPDNEKGQLVAKLLRIAFDRRLIFTIGDSRTTGKTGVVTWNDIHHKTNDKPHTQYGYPDPDYLDRVLDELAAKGVTKDDITSSTVIY